MNTPRWTGFLLIALSLALFVSLAACGDVGDDDDDDMGDDDDDDDNDDDTDGGDDDDATGDDDDSYPAGRDDGTFADDPEPFVSGYEGRRAAYLEACGLNAGTSIYAQVCKLNIGAGPLNPDAFTGALQKMNDRRDAADFNLQAIVRILAKYPDDLAAQPDLEAGVMDAVQNFKYWIDEPGLDGMCYWSENHYLLFNSAAMILGGLFPAMDFPNTPATGAQLRAKARANVIRWLDAKLRWGFFEFHSDVYYNEDGGPLMNLIDFADDEEVQVKAMMVMDLLLYDMALGNHEGLFGMPHGRSYMKDKQSRDKEDTHAAIWLAFGKGEHNNRWDMTTTGMADSDLYAPPEAIESVGASRPRGLVARQRMGINVADGPGYGISYTDPADVVFWWTMGAYAMPEIIDGTFTTADAYGLLEGSGFFGPFSILQPLADLGILGTLAEYVRPLVSGSALEQVNTYIYRTPEVMLTSAQDWKPSTLGAQTHIWQASLGPETLVFTTQPGDLADDSFAGHWTGGFHPRVGQYRTAAIVLHDLPEFDVDAIGGILDFVMPDYTHAYFPQEFFDEVRQVGSWTFGRLGDGYVALYSHNPAEWVEEGEWALKEITAKGTRNVWICEVGDSTMYDSFDEFVQAVSDAEVRIWETDVEYDSPGQGWMEYHWRGPLFVRGEAVEQGPYPRFDNPYSVTAFDAGEAYHIVRGDREVILDPATLTRTLIQ